MILTATIFAICSSALADRFELYATNGMKRMSPADAVVIEMLTLEQGIPVNHSPPDVVDFKGAEHKVLKMGPGRWRSTIDAPAQSSTFTVSWQSRQQIVQVPSVTFMEPKLRGPTRIDGDVGRPVHFTVHNDDGTPVSAAQLTFWTSEGHVEATDKPDGTVGIKLTPEGSPYPRAVPILVQYEGDLHSPPLFTIARFTANPSIPVTTEPGAEVELTVGDTTYGPIVADESGSVAFQVRIEPGVTEAQVTLQDTLGNRQTSKVLLGGDVGPQLALSHRGNLIAGGLPPTIYIAATNRNGEPWNGKPPRCTGTGSDIMLAVEDGLWLTKLAGDANMDSRVQCTVDRGSAGVLAVPIAKTRATRLILQSYPQELSADIPVAEIQAYLINGMGDRLPAEGISLSAAYGTIVPDQNGDRSVLRARYDGTLASDRGEDIVRASWKRPQGKGGVWDLAIRAASPKGSQAALVDVRAVDQGGRPLPNIPVQFKFGQVEHVGSTGPDGWSTHTFPWKGAASAAIIEASIGNANRRTIVYRKSRALPAGGQPDLITETLLPIRPGRIHGVVLNVNPRVLTNDGMVGKVEVHLEDKAKNRVVGQTVQMSASAGTVGPTSTSSDGIFSAQYAPPIGMPPGRVRLTATTEDGQFSASTDVEIIPRIVDWSLGAGAGYVFGPAKLAEPFLSLQFEKKLPVPTLYLRIDGSAYTVSIEDVDPITSTAIKMQTTVLPMGIGAVVQRGLGRLPVRFGGQAVFSPYSLSAAFDGLQASAGTGWMLPGAAFLSGVGWRVGGGELFTEVKYLFLLAPGETLGWEGALGGMVGTMGYKLLY